jgi:hypothetical protein
MNMKEFELLFFALLAPCFTLQERATRDEKSQGEQYWPELPTQSNIICRSATESLCLPSRLLRSSNELRAQLFLIVSVDIWRF